MKALITTSHSILLFDSAGSWNVFHRGSGLYYGITRFKDDIYVASRRRDVFDGGSPINDRGCLIKLDHNSGQASLIEPNIKLRDLHGISSVKDTIWCSCSYDNAIAVMIGDNFYFEYPFGRPKNEPFDVNHINTIVERSEGVFIVAHNWGNSEVYLLNPSTFSTLWRQKIGKGAHNIWFDGDKMRVCSSLEHALIGPDNFYIYVGGHPRGYSSNGHVRLIGINEFVSRESRVQTTSQVLILDINYKTIAAVPLPGEGQVLDIMEISDEEFNIFNITLLSN